MTRSTWYADIDFTSSVALTEGVDFAVLEALSDYSTVMSLSNDRTSGSLSFTLSESMAVEAATSAAEVLKRVYKALGPIEVTKLEVMNEKNRLMHNDSPSFPELVGYVEIAQLAHISRQRARQIASREDFPTPVVETAAGPLRTKAAVEQWLRGWDRTPGRPRSVHV